MIKAKRVDRIMSQLKQSIETGQSLSPDVESVLAQVLNMQQQSSLQESKDYSTGKTKFPVRQSSRIQKESQEGPASDGLFEELDVLHAKVPKISSQASQKTL